MPTFKFAPNVPATVELGYIDIVPSEKGPCQVRLKGKINGEEKFFAYLPGKLVDTLAVLIAAGIIANKEYPLEVAAPVEVKPIKKEFTMVKEQLAGDKYGSFKIVGNGNGASAAVPAAASNGGGAAGIASAPVKSYSDLYGKATDYIISTILPKYKAAGKAVETPEVIAMVRDLFFAKANAA